MSQSFPAIPQTQTVKDSRQPLIDRDEAAASSFSGTAFPSTGLLVGMRCHRTDLNKVYVLKDATPTWIEVEDVSGASGKAPTATQLATSRNFSITGDGAATAVAFNGTASVVLTLALATTGVTAGTYTKVTVDAKGRVTGGAAIANADLPADLSRTTLRAAGASVTLSSTNHGLGVGPDSGANLAFDGNQIQGRNNGAVSAVRINFLGGNVVLGDGANTTITLDGLLSSASQMLATNAEAAAGTVNNKVMTPLRTAQATAPTAMSSNAMTDVTASRAFGTVYQNTSSSWRAVSARGQNNGLVVSAGPTSTPANVIAQLNSAFNGVFVLVPPGWYYKVDGSILVNWFES